MHVQNVLGFVYSFALFVDQNLLGDEADGVGDSNRSIEITGMEIN